MTDKEYSDEKNALEFLIEHNHGANKKWYEDQLEDLENEKKPPGARTPATCVSKTYRRSIVPRERWKMKQDDFRIGPTPTD